MTNKRKNFPPRGQTEIKAPDPAPPPHQAHDADDPFPVDHNLWTLLWNAWRMRNDDRLRPLIGRNPFKSQNLMAENVLGVWTINDVVTELSAVLMPTEIRPDIQVIRYVGITSSGGEADIVGSFTELEAKLWPSP